MVYSIVYEQQLHDITTYRAYDTIQSWIHSQGGKVRENHRPNLIIATHGSAKQRYAWEKNSRKTLRFELEQKDASVLVRVHVSPLAPPEKEAALLAREGDARANWGALLRTLWSRFGASQTVQDLEGNIPEGLSQSMKRGRRMISAGTALSVAGLVFSFVVPEILTGVAIVASSMGIILMINGYMKVRSATKSLSASR